ncbi:hypothetical protein BDZ97DRAFT_1746014 [Flammula alnicola]|nr:hypothetical protein BDZ97DRAFT_1746014 [Flammula alnicola]
MTPSWTCQDERRLGPWEHHVEHRLPCLAPQEELAKHQVPARQVHDGQAHSSVHITAVTDSTPHDRW